MPLNLKEIQQLAEEWYAALDQHLPLSDVLNFLVDDDLEMRFPEMTAKGHAGFTDWYDAVTHRFFDEQHTVTKVDGPVDGDEATVSVLVHWEARLWDAPGPKSSWLGFDADQTWVVVSVDGVPKIKTYIVNELAPVPGSASL